VFEELVPLDGSEVHPSDGVVRLGPVDRAATLRPTIVLKRRPDGPPVSEFAYFLRPET
jgi:hypothetical protein